MKPASSITYPSNCLCVFGAFLVKSNVYIPFLHIKYFLSLSFFQDLINVKHISEFEVVMSFLKLEKKIKHDIWSYKIIFFFFYLITRQSIYMDDLEKSELYIM